MSTNEKKGKSLLSRLRVAVQKVRLLLSSTILGHTWRAAEILRGASLGKRQVSFNDRQGLMICSEETESEVDEVSPSRNSLQRTISFPSSDDDIDKRAEMFISKFRRQLRMERQISLQLRYGKGHGSELVSP